MGLNTMGLGIILSMRDMASVPAMRAAGALGQLDRASQDFSNNFNSAIATALEGMNMLSSGLLLAAAPMKFIKSTFETQQALAGIATLGYKEIDKLKEAAEDFTNEWAGAMQKDFLETAHFIKSGIVTLSDEAVAEFTKATGVVGRATKSNIKELTELMPIMYGILRESLPDATDMEFIDALSGALPEAVKLYRTTGKYMGDAFSQASALATSMGVAMEEQFAIIGQMQQTMTGSEAGTKFRAFVRSIARAEDTKAKLGIDIEFADQSGMLLPMLDVLENLKNEFGETLTLENAEKLRKLFGSREAVSAITNLLPHVDKLRGDMVLLSNAMGKGLVHATEMAKTASDQIADSWERLKQRANNLSQTIGEALIPVFKPFIDFGGNILIVFQKIIKANPFIVQLIGSASTLIGGLLAMVGVVFILSAAFKMINGAIILMKSRLVLLKLEFMKLAITLWPFIVLAGLLYLAFKGNFMGIGDAAMFALDKIKLFFKGVKMVWGGLKELFSNFDGRSGMISEELYNALNEAGLWEITKKLFMIGVRLHYLWEGIKEGFRTFWEVLVAIVTPIAMIIDFLVVKPIMWAISKLAKFFPVLNKLIAPTEENVNAWQKVGRVIGFVLGIFSLLALPLKLLTGVWGAIVKIGGAFKFLFGVIAKVGGLLWKAFAWIGGIVAAILGIPAWLGMVIVAAVALIVFLIIKYFDQFKEILKGIGLFILGVFQAIFSFIAGLILGTVAVVIMVASMIIGAVAILGLTIAEIVIGIVAAFVGAAYAIIATFQTALHILGAIFGIAFEIISGIIKTFMAIIKAIITLDFESLGGILKEIWSGVWDNIKGIVDVAIEGIKNAWSGVKDFFTGIWDEMKGIASKFFDWIEDKFSWIFKGIEKVKGGIDWAKDGMSKGWDKIAFWKKDKNDPSPMGTYSTPDIQQYASGGVFTGPSVIEVGEQFGVSEAVIPLNGIHMFPFAQEIASLMSGMFSDVDNEKPTVIAIEKPAKSPYNRSTINNFYSNRSINENNTNINESNTNNIPTSSGGVSKTVIEVPVNIDGRQISKVVAEHIDRERRR